MRVLISLVALIVLTIFIMIFSITIVFARGYEAYDPATGQTIYYTQERNGFNAYDPSTGQTTYISKTND